MNEETNKSNSDSDIKKAIASTKSEPAPKMEVSKTKEIPKKYLLIYSSGRTKTQSVLFPDTVEQHNSGELTSLIELTGMLLFQGGTNWGQIPHMDYTPPVPVPTKVSEPIKET